ncbi:MAG TPA: hypothetical protein GXZ65_01950 [Clostridiales bacterium]|jgi:hypothetical protein|nr:hypothetical protein [Clostridiales bacterium]
MSDGRKSKAGRGFLKATAKLLKKAGSETAKIAKIAKLSAEINSAKEGIRTAQLELGKMYYETFKDEPHPQFAENCIRIKKSIEAIQEKKQLIEELKSGVAEKDKQEEFFS